jgi:DNA-directed RNA polymerase subunit RPC12/RpoP
MKEILVKCKHCSKEVDLKKLVKATRGHEIKCTHCKGKIGTV